MAVAKKNAPRKLKPGRPVGSTNKHGIKLSAEIQNIIARKKRFTHQRDIVEALLKNKNLGDVNDEKAFKMKTSVLLQSLLTRNKLSQYSASDSTRGKYYGLPEWLKKNKPVEGTAPKVK
nr:hypothetical protein [uncultured Flavobacterium sp.]